MLANSNELETAPNAAGEGAPRLPCGRRSDQYLGMSLFAIVVIACFWKPLLRLGQEAVQSELDSYTLLIPFISAYLVYLRRNALPRDSARSLPWAALLFGVALLALAAAWIAGPAALGSHDYISLLTFSWLCFLMGGGFLFLGKGWIAAAAFPVALLFLTIPLPGHLVDAIESASKLASADAANLFFQLLGTPVLRDGTIFSLPDITIEVAQECSGIHSSLVLFITSLIAANLILRSPWRRLLLVAFVIPLGILRNGFRILVIGLLCIHIGPEMINSPIHRKGGPLFFALSLIPFFIVLSRLRKGETTCRQRRRLPESPALPAQALPDAK
jgi:exosortase C (VPDSG-CTERM-specific)